MEQVSEKHKDGLCECSNWGGTIGPFLTEHHHQCRHYNPSADAASTISSLLKAMRDWGAMEDGIPESDGIADAYDRAAIKVFEKTLKDQY